MGDGDFSQSRELSTLNDLKRVAELCLDNWQTMEAAHAADNADIKEVSMASLCLVPSWLLAAQSLLCAQTEDMIKPSSAQRQHLPANLQALALCMTKITDLVGIDDTLHRRLDAAQHFLHVTTQQGLHKFMVSAQATVKQCMGTFEQYSSTVSKELDEINSMAVPDVEQINGIIDSDWVGTIHKSMKTIRQTEKDMGIDILQHIMDEHQYVHKALAT